MAGDSIPKDELVSVLLETLREQVEGRENAEWLSTIRERLETSGFYEHLDTRDTIGLILRCHLWVESAFHDIVRTVVPEPEHLSDRMGLRAMLRLVQALGLTVDAEAAFVALNSLRNKAGHSWGWVPSEDEMKSFVAAHGGLDKFTSADTDEKFWAALIMTAFDASLLEHEASVVIGARRG